MCGVSADASFSNALSTSSRNGVPDSDSSSVRLKYSAHSSDTRQAGRQPLERLAVDAPARPAVVVRSVVEEREARLLERLQIAPDRAGRDVAERRELVDGDAGAARAFDLAQDRPLPDDFRVARHGRF